MRRGALSYNDSIERAPHLYWTYSLWLVAGVTLVALLVHNLVPMPLDVTHIFIAVVFALLSSMVLAQVLKSEIASEHPKLIKAFFIFSNVRLITAVILIVGYALFTHLRGMELLPFVIVLFVYFILQDALNTLLVVRLHQKLNHNR